MKKIQTVLFLLLFSLAGISQRIRLDTMTKELPAFPRKSTAKRPVLLYFMAGFDDSVCIYLNKKLIQCSYIESISYLNHSYGISPIRLYTNDYVSSNLLELRMNRSGKVYYIKLIRGYLVAIFYLENSKTVLFANKSPMLE